jgi:hypothetical protein
MYRFVLYYGRSAQYQDRVKLIVEALEKIRQKWKIEFNVLETEAMDPTQAERVKKDIRSITPQVRGRIVSAQSIVLPFSKSKNLNTTNTPVIMLYRNEEPVNVYPHMLGTAYFEIEQQLKEILESGPEAHMTAKGLLEEPIQKILADAPYILEEGMRFLEANRDVGFGLADVLLQDLNGRVVIVEIETRASEAAVAQVSRLAAGYASQKQLSVKNVRKVILCQSFEESAAKACRGTNVELYRLNVEKIC